MKRFPLILLPALILLSTLNLSAKAPDGPKGPILRGPVLGSPAPHSIAVWIQGAWPMRLRLKVAPADQRSWKKALSSDFISLETENRLMGIFHIEGLMADTRYCYRVEDENGPIWSDEETSFRTPPEIGAATHLRFAAGSGANTWLQPYPKVWKAIANDQPNFFLALGDTPYADGQLWLESQSWENAREDFRTHPGRTSRRNLENAATSFRQKAREAIPIAYEYFREAPGLGRLSSRSFWVATWDDHETGVNNGDREDPVWKIAIENFRRFTPNPSFGLPDAKGAFWVLHWGDVDVFLLDDQSYRTPTVEALKDPDHATILGKKQREWLIQGLKDSKAVFKIIVSGSPFNNNTRKDDSWVVYPKERKRILDVITRARIEGVLLLTGDVHRSEIFRLPWLEESGGYPLYEIVSSPLYQRSRNCGPTVKHRIFCSGSAEHQLRELYGYFDIDTRKKDPSITFEVRGLEEEVLYSQTLLASELSWKAAKEKK